MDDIKTFKEKNYIRKKGYPTFKLPKTNIVSGSLVEIIIDGSTFKAKLIKRKNYTDNGKLPESSDLFRVYSQQGELQNFKKIGYHKNFKGAKKNLTISTATKAKGMLDMNLLKESPHYSKTSDPLTDAFRKLRLLTKFQQNGKINGSNSEEEKKFLNNFSNLKDDDKRHAIEELSSMVYKT